jgi:hypothetical protein
MCSVYLSRAAIYALVLVLRKDGLLDWQKNKNILFWIESKFMSRTFEIKSKRI